jgi:S1-C subfamily serine protease
MIVRVRFRHLSGPRQDAVDEVSLPAVLGSAPEADVVAAGAASRHALVFERDGEIVLQSAGAAVETRINGEDVKEAVLREGDVLELAPDGPRLRLEAGEGPGEEMLEAATWERQGFFASPRALVGYVSYSFARLSPPLRRLLAVGLVIGTAAIVFNYFQERRLRLEVEHLREALREGELERAAFAARVAEERQRGESDRAALALQLQELRQREETLYGQLQESAAAEAGTLRGELAATRERLAALESERAAGERIVRDYGPGVCLIHGSYLFQDAEGRPLRYRLDEKGESMKDADDNPVLDPEGKGPVHEVEYVGTGFLVDRRGLILTNRHIAEPWWSNDLAQSLAERGYSPKQTALRAFFPRERKPFELSLEKISEHADLSLLRCDLRGRRLPTLPLDRTGKGAVTGQAVVLVGFPAGIEAMLAKIDAGLAREIVTGAGMSTARITEALAERGLVRPSTTQGHIADITDTDVVFDAPTTQGGSGGPLLNRNGQVIGVAYAVLSRFGGNSFAVPVRRALPLVAPAGPVKPPSGGSGAKAAR